MKNKFAYAVLLWGASSPVLSDNNDIEVVDVFGARQAYQGSFTPLETPQSELKIDSETLLNAGALDLNQALDLSASVARQNNFGGLWNSFAIRGFVGDENLPSNYLVNGFNAGRGFGGPRDLSGIESVEVLKGPRAALYGRGEPGGTINLVTKRPTFETAGEIRLSAGSFDTYRADADWTGPLSDQVAIRLVGFHEDAGSFRDTIDTLRQGLSPSLAIKIDEQSQVAYEMEYSHQEIPFDRGVVAIDGELGRIPESRFLGEPGDGPMKADVLGHQLEFQHEFNQDWNLLLGANYRETSLQGVATETNLSTLTGDVNRVGRFRRSRDYDATYQVLRAELTGHFNTIGLEHRIIVGVDSDKFENDQVFLRVRGGQEIDIFNPIYGDYELPTPTANTDRIEIQKSVGIYIQDQISLTEQLDIRIGARFDEYDQSLKNRRSGKFTQRDESEVSPQFGVVYQANETLSLYAAYGENFRLLSGPDPMDNAHDPNDSTSVEAGVKFELNDGALVGTASVFQVEQGNILGVTDPDTFLAIAAGEAESQGFEIDLVGTISDGLNLWASYAYVNAEISNEFLDPNFALEIPAGSPLLNIPEHQLTLQLLKESSLAGQTLKYGGGLIYIGERNGYFGRDFELPDYTIVKLFADYEIVDDVNLRLDVDNALDEEYYPNSFADTWVQPGAPVNARISAIIKF